MFCKANSTYRLKSQGRAIRSWWQPLLQQIKNTRLRDKTQKNWPYSWKVFLESWSVHTSKGAKRGFSGPVKSRHQLLVLGVNPRHLHHNFFRFVFAKIELNKRIKNHEQSVRALLTKYLQTNVGTAHGRTTPSWLRAWPYSKRHKLKSIEIKSGSVARGPTKNSTWLTFWGFHGVGDY